MSLGVKKLCYDAIVPTRGSDGAVGYDLYSSEDAVVPCQAGRALVGTGITVVLPPGVYGRVAPRSGLAVKHCINVGAGVIDPDYTGEIKVVLFNHGEKTLKSRKAIVLLNLFWRGVKHLPSRRLKLLKRRSVVRVDLDLQVSEPQVLCCGHE
jgi:dUTP pyrophosphatase